jgi:predicted DNA-binding helix-hairpin-helix protein
MAQLRTRIDAAKEDAKAPQFAPGGQSTQVIVGADDSTDQAIIEKSATLYSSYRLRRVYYSAFSPIPDSSKQLPVKPAPLIREHRLYQADWLLRFYGFDANEIFAQSDGMLDLDVDPKLAWALKHRERFPLDINKCSREELLRVPGLGTKAVDRILAARVIRKIRFEDLQRLRVPVKRVLPFIKLPGHQHATALDSEKLTAMLKPEPRQMSLLGRLHA